MANSNYDAVKDQEMNVVTNSNHKVPSQVDKTTFNTPTRFQPEVSMNLDYDQMNRLRTDPGANVVAIAEEHMPSEEAGMDPNAYMEIDEGYKRTALTFSVADGHLDGARFLLENGANPNFLSGQHSMIMLAVAQKNYDMVNELLTHGADPDLNYKNFRSPLNTQPSWGPQSQRQECWGIVK
ncbi:ankyrin repeat domain-containing protein [Brevibacillus sp. AG]|uniref:ankyrin repeat domain-containing protein n=1 Tax=Brevibacillus sp. AG TaxID=3020891 RepID=UPI001FCD3650|nr:ankyrin repeat domain-containing protein [Brevibacillus sp. AG]MDC0763877.1 ankyrin repeat domain-containing protein [Brevibacillus sp. AG]